MIWLPHVCNIFANFWNKTILSDIWGKFSVSATQLTIADF